MQAALLADVVAVLEKEGSSTASRWLELSREPHALSRKGFPGHFTASALPVSLDGTKVCLVLHRRLGQWVQPGGHFETSDSSLVEAAGRELREETGLTGHIDPVPVLLSRHPAPCRSGAWHYDLQLRAVVTEAGVVASEESLDVGWFPIGRLPDDLAPGVEDLVVAAVSRIAVPESPSPGL